MTELTKKSEVLMNSIVDANGKKISIYVRESDGYIDATEMCKSAGKKWSNYYRLDGTSQFLEVIESEAHISRSLLIEDNRSNSDGADRHTWVHMKIAMHLATWLSPVFMSHVLDTVTKYAKGELTISDVQAQIVDETVQESVFDENQQQIVKKLNTMHLPECWLYVRGVNPYLFDYDDRTEDTNEKKITKNILKFGIADNLGKRDISYGKDNGMFFYAIQLDSRKDAKYIEDIFRVKFKNISVEKSFEYVDSLQLEQFYHLEESICTSSDGYRALSLLLYSDILKEIYSVFPQYRKRIGVQIEQVIKQKKSVASFFGKKPVTENVVNIEDMEYRKVDLVWDDVKDVFAHLIDMPLGFIPGPVTMKTRKVQTFDSGIQCTPEMIKDTFVKLDEETSRLKKGGLYGYQESRPNYKTYIQRILADDLTVVDKFYKSYAEAAEDNKCATNQIKDAVRDTRIINGYRWNVIDNKLDPKVVPVGFPATIVRKEKNTGEPICMIHPTSGKIMKIYESQRKASTDMKVNPAAINNAMKKESRSSGHLWKLMKNCDDKKLKEYEDLHGKWNASVKRNKIIQQIDPNTDTCLREFSSFAAVSDILHCAPQSISTAIKEKSLFRGSYWKSIET